jgi:hypothetical protein
MKHNSNTRKYLLSLSIILCLSTSCEKVIDLEIDNASKKYVIEGEVSTDRTVGSLVKISQTKSFEDDNNFNGIGGAIVTIQVNNGTPYNLTQTSNGIYENKAMFGISGNTYKLKIVIDGNTFNATSKLPNYVNLDTLTVENFALGGSDDLTIQPSYLDPIGIGNSYRFIQYRNNVQVKKVFVQNDAISDGRTITRPLVNRDNEIIKGDFIKVVMECIDADVYNYWFSLDQASTGNNQSATPTNPVTNISGGALGVFSAHTVSTKSIKVQ